VSLRQVRFIRLSIHRMIPGSSPSGLPHSDSHGSTLARNSPWLFAARCVLLRRLMPRHPPYALPTLTFLRLLLFPCIVKDQILEFQISDLKSLLKSMVEVNGIEPMTPCLQSRCSPS